MTQSCLVDMYQRLYPSLSSATNTEAAVSCNKFVCIYQSTRCYILLTIKIINPLKSQPRNSVQSLDLYTSIISQCVNTCKYIGKTHDFYVNLKYDIEGETTKKYAVFHRSLCLPVWLCQCAHPSRLLR
jgi:hypothetical protein